MKINLFENKKGKINIHLHSMLKLSKGCNLHLVAGISLGKYGFAIYFLAFSIGIGWNE